MHLIYTIILIAVVVVWALAMCRTAKRKVPDKQAEIKAGWASH